MRKTRRREEEGIDTRGKNTRGLNTKRVILKRKRADIRFFKKKAATSFDI
jgi:hypothetical protein